MAPPQYAGFHILILYIRVFKRERRRISALGLRLEAKEKILKEAGRDENRSLSNFIKHCLLTYLKEKKGIDYKEED